MHYNIFPISCLTPLPWFADIQEKHSIYFYEANSKFGCPVANETSQWYCGLSAEAQRRVKSELNNAFNYGAAVNGAATAN